MDCGLLVAFALAYGFAGWFGLLGALANSSNLSVE
jgi:hypothetical protein